MEGILEEPDTVEGLILHVKSCLYRRKFDQVISLSNKIWEIDREEPMVWYFKGKRSMNLISWIFSQTIKARNKAHDVTWPS